MGRRLQPRLLFAAHHQQRTLPAFPLIKTRGNIMLGQNRNFVITQHALPTQKGEFTLDLPSERTILSIQQLEPGKPVVVVQQAQGKSAGRPEKFTLVETGENFSTEERWPDETQVIGSFAVDGKLL